MDLSNGSHFTVKVNGRDYDTVILNGVQRFVGNRIVGLFVEQTMDNYDRWTSGQRQPLHRSD